MMLISDDGYGYSLLHSGKEGALQKTNLNNSGAPDWTTSRSVDFLRLAPGEELYLRMIVGMLIALEHYKP